MKIEEFQRLIEETYYAKDAGRGWHETFIWFVEEVGELGRALRSQPREQVESEFADVFAWLSTLASIHGVDLAEAVQKKYGDGCPKCSSIPCKCVERKQVI
jgi:NTP pyrophosphatase (non-canonical NTP hydrolase)